MGRYQCSLVQTMKCYMCVSRLVLLIIVLSQQTQAMEGDKNSTRIFKKVLCSRGETTNKRLALRAKDTVLFVAINGVKACFSYFKLHRTCAKMRMTCLPVKKFYINCDEGDRMVVRTKKKTLKYCYHAKPQYSGSPGLPDTKSVYSTSSIKLDFITPSRNSKARCKIRCAKKRI